MVRELLVEAKRSRAGRGGFLPGAWEALKAPLPPIETWKLPLYDAAKTEEQGLQLRLERFIPAEPLHQLFERAWNRIVEGDVPRYEEVG